MASPVLWAAVVTPLNERIKYLYMSLVFSFTRQTQTHNVAWFLSIAGAIQESINVKSKQSIQMKCHRTKYAASKSNFEWT